MRIIEIKLKVIITQNYYISLKIESKCLKINSKSDKNEEFDFEDALEADDDKEIKIPKIPIKYIIIDCSPINFIDSVGVKAMKHVN